MQGAQGSRRLFVLLKWTERTSRTSGRTTARRDTWGRLVNHLFLVLAVLTALVNRFSYIRSNIAPSHSSAPVSFCIANLPIQYRHVNSLDYVYMLISSRYRTLNLMCTSIMPGPKEQTADQVQRYLRPIISDLLRLWKHGIKISTPSCPNGRLVRVILIAIVCDKPAAHKLAGFASHSHTYYCTECWICSQEKMTRSAFERGGK